MPLYEYLCRDCRHPFEVLQRMGEDGKDLRCPSCGAIGADRQFSTFAGRATTSGAGDAGCSAPGCGPGAFT